MRGFLNFEMYSPFSGYSFPVTDIFPQKPHLLLY